MAAKALAYAWRVLEIEANSSTDNPLVLKRKIKSFPVGIFMANRWLLAWILLPFLQVLWPIYEFRIEKLINPAMSDLPAFLTRSSLNSGHMIVQVAAASLVSENKILAHPASVDSIPTSDKEDHTVWEPYGPQV